MDLFYTIREDNRIGPIITTYSRYEVDLDSEDSDAPPADELCTIKLDPPLLADGKYRVYVINDFPDYKEIWHTDCDKSQYLDIYLKIFSQIHGHMPFVHDGEYTPGYRETGHYSEEISPEIRNIPNYEVADMVKKDNGSKYYFLLVVDSGGNDVMVKMLTPIC